MQNQTFGDQLTLYAAANLYNVNVHVISSLGVGANHTFSPSFSIPLTTVYLGHLAENHGEHYVSLTSGVQTVSVAVMTSWRMRTMMVMP